MPLIFGNPHIDAHVHVDADVGMYADLGMDMHTDGDTLTIMGVWHPQYLMLFGDFQTWNPNRRALIVQTPTRRIPNS